MLHLVKYMFRINAFMLAITSNKVKMFNSIPNILDSRGRVRGEGERDGTTIITKSNTQTTTL